MDGRVVGGPTADGRVTDGRDTTAASHDGRVNLTSNIGRRSILPPLWSTFFLEAS